MEVTFVCKDGQQLCSQWILGYSQYFSEQITGRDRFGNPLKFNFPDHSRACVKLFLDCLHLIPAGPTDIATILECVDFCQFEGKASYDSFEVELVKRLMAPVMKAALPLGTKLLICAYLAHVDNFDNRYQSKVAKKLTKEAVSFLLYDFDFDNALNKRLIEMCVQKNFFADNSKQSVIPTLLMYGKELHQNPAGNFESMESYVEDEFKPNPSSARY